MISIVDIFIRPKPSAANAKCSARAAAGGSFFGKNVTLRRSTLLRCGVSLLFPACQPGCFAAGKTETVHRGLSRQQPVPVARCSAARGKIRFSANRRSKMTRLARWIRRTLVRGSIGVGVVYQVPRRISTPRRPSRRWRSQKPGSRCAKEASIRPPALMLSRLFLIGRVRSSVAATVVGANALWSIVFMVGAPRLRCETSGQDTHRGSSHRIGQHQ